MENPDYARLQLNRRACTTRRQLSSALRDAASSIALAIQRLKALLSSATVITDLDARPTVRAIATAACSRAATILGSRNMENDNRSSPLEHNGYTRKHVVRCSRQGLWPRWYGVSCGGNAASLATACRLCLQRKWSSKFWEEPQHRAGDFLGVVVVTTTMRFASQLPRDAAKSTSFTSRPQLRRHPLQRIQPFIATTSNYWFPTYSNHFAIRPQLRWTPLQRNPPAFSQTNLSKTNCWNSTHAIGLN